MKSIHTELQKYAKKCDEVLLSKNLKKLVEEANEHIPQISAKQLDKIKNKVIVIDVREPEEFASGYIPADTVLTIPRGKLEFMAIDKIAKEFGEDAQIVTYCLKGARGSLAALHLKKLGFKNISNLDGGILAWLKKGYSIKNYLGELKLIKS